MIAIEKIKEIEASLLSNPELNDEFEIFVERSKAKFILKAFKVMENLAIEAYRYDGYSNDIGIDEAKKELHKDFEKAMKE